MGKIYRYECRRLLWNQFFAGLAAVLLGYGALVLRGVTILGVSHTWSFGDYLSRMLPLLWIGALFFLTFFTSPKARRTAALTDAAPMRPARFALARCAAAFTGTVILALLCIVEAAVFYGRMFGWYSWGSLAFPALATLLLAVLPLPDTLGLWNGNFFTDYPLTLTTLDPAFVLPGDVVVAQIVQLATGVVLLVIHRVDPRKNK